MIVLLTIEHVVKEEFFCHKGTYLLIPLSNLFWEYKPPEMNLGTMLDLEYARLEIIHIMDELGFEFAGKACSSQNELRITYAFKATAIPSRKMFRSSGFVEG